MIRKRISAICLILLMLFLTACGGPGSTASEAQQNYGIQVQIQFPETEASSAETQQNHESEIQIQLPESEVYQESTPEDYLPIYGDYYYDLTNVVLYLEVYDELPPNYITKSEARSLGWEGGSVEQYQEGAAIGGDRFGNREGLLPEADGRNYTECDIDTNGYNSRGSRRLVFSNDGLYFYTSDHYETFLEVTVTEEYEVIW